MLRWLGSRAATTVTDARTSDRPSHGRSPSGRRRGRPASHPLAFPRIGAGGSVSNHPPAGGCDSSNAKPTSSSRDGRVRVRREARNKSARWQKEKSPIAPQGSCRARRAARRRAKQRRSRADRYGRPLRRGLERACAASRSRGLPAAWNCGPASSRNRRSRSAHRSRAESSAQLPPSRGTVARHGDSPFLRGRGEPAVRIRRRDLFCIKKSGAAARALLCRTSHP